MGILADLSEKLDLVLGKINTSLIGKLGRNETAADSNKLAGKNIQQVADDVLAAAKQERDNEVSHVRGSIGELPFVAEEGVPMGLSPMGLMGKIRIASDDTGVNNAKNSVVSMQSIFDSWKRISHLQSGTFPHDPSELSTWSYDVATDSFMSTTNSVSMVGLVSREKYDSYDMDVVVKSSNSDDDVAGVIIAFVMIGNVEHTLSLAISTGGMNDVGVVVNDQPAKALIIENLSQGDINGKRIHQRANLSPAPAGWSAPAFADGFRCRIKRFESGMYEVVVSGAGSTVMTPVTFTGELPEKFKTPCSIGLMAWSQANTSWKFTKFPAVRQPIVDTRDKTVWKWDGNAWVNAGHISNFQALMPGRIYKDVSTPPYTTFYLDHSGEAFIIGGSNGLAL